MKPKKKQKQKSMSEAEYIAIFCNEKRIRDRRAVYISPGVHKRLQKAVHTFMDYHVTTMSMVDAILSHHFEVNEELLSRLYNEEMKKVLTLNGIEDNDSPSTIDGEDETDRP